jgi:glycosyltransferase involved in cell wall biosynthesis
MTSPLDQAKHVLRRTYFQVYPHLPASVRSRIVERKHIKIVSANLEQLTHAGFIQPHEEMLLTWTNPDITLTGPDIGLELHPLTEADAVGIRSWLSGQSFDSDEHLDMRMDGFHDEVGQTIAALNTRLRLHALKSTPLKRSSGHRILFDARSLQTSVISGRGIGRFAAAALAGIADSDPLSVTLLVDRGKPPLPESVSRGCVEITQVTPEIASDFSLFIQPSPMTSPINQYEEILHQDIRKVALIYDFIPADFPQVYLSRYAARAQYCAALDSLSFYTDFVCISHLIKNKLSEFNVDPAAAREAVVAWPDSIVNQLREITQDRDRASNSAVSNRIVVMSGDEPRKNTVGALGAAGAVTSSEPSRDIVVIGMPRHQNLVHHLSMYAAIRPGEVVAQEHLTDADMFELISASGVVMVASFDEGLSLPVMEALRCGTPVVASDISAHRELIGHGPFLADPHSVKDMTRALKFARNNQQLAQQQLHKLLTHQHNSLEAVMANFVAQRPQTTGQEIPRVDQRNANPRLNVGIATPWVPQASGVADFSTTIFTELAQHADLTLYLTASSLEDTAKSVTGIFTIRPVSDLLARNGHHDHDFLISVVGNSHFHLPFIELLTLTPCVVVAHDTRMVEFYMALRGIGGAEEVMLTSLDSPSARLHPTLEEQVADMRLLSNLGLWEIARRADSLIMHSVSCREMVAAQTGVTPHVLPFSNQRIPLGDVDNACRLQARERVGFTPEQLHLVTFGYVDLRTKLNDQLLAAAGWLTAWGHNVHITFAGGASEAVTEELMEIAGRLGVSNVKITGFLGESDYQDYLLAADIGIQLRVSDFLGVSGPLSDLAAFGTTGIATEGLARDISAPPYIHPVSVWSSGVQLAEEVLRVAGLPSDPEQRERERVEYLDRMSPTRYVQQLMQVLSVS